MKRQERTIREEYLRITDEQEKADFLWNHRISAATLALQNIRVCGVNEIMSDENVVYFTVREGPEEGAADD